MNDLITRAESVNVEDAMMRRPELEIIYNAGKEYYKGGNILEVGAYKGMTSYLLLGVMNEYAEVPESSRLYIVDIFKTGHPKSDWNWPYKKHPVSLIKKNLKEYGDMFVLLKGLSLDNDIITNYMSRTYDFVFIDGDHRFGTLLSELLLTDLVTDHMLGHDYGHPGVTQAVDTFCNKRGYEMKKFDNTYGLFEIIKNGQ